MKIRLLRIYNILVIFSAEVFFVFTLCSSKIVDYHSVLKITEFDSKWMNDSCLLTVLGVY